MTVDELVRLAALRATARSGRARHLRQFAGLSQTEVAEAVGVDRVTLASWESGRRRPRSVAGLRYADVLERLSAAAEFSGTGALCRLT